MHLTPSGFTPSFSTTAVLEKRVGFAEAKGEAERRTQRRLSVNREARIRLLEDASERIRCLVIAMNGQTMDVRLEAPLPPGAIVQVITDQWIIMAEVRHSGKDANGCVVGLAIHNALEIQTLMPKK